MSEHEMKRADLLALIRAQRAGGASRHALMEYLSVEPGPDACLTWAAVSLAEVIVGHQEREVPLEEGEAVASAPPAVRVLLTAASYHRCTDVHLGGFQLRALDTFEVDSPAAIGARCYEGMKDWGGGAGKRVRLKKAGIRLALGSNEALLGWSPGRSGATLAVFTNPLAGVHDSEREDWSFASVSQWILELLDQNTFEFAPGELGQMHPSYKARGRVNGLEEVCTRLGRAIDEEEWF